MSISSRIIAKVFKLPVAETHDVVVERNLKVPMPDGVVLSADHYYPRGSLKLPTILIRCPYGRGSLYGMSCRLFAEHGFQVLIQSCRGTFGSGGQFHPFRYEHTDGPATIEWMKKQGWFSGEFATQGPSYLGYVQWAIARDAGPELKAIAAQITASEFRSITYPGESFGLFSALSWLYLVNKQEESWLGGFAGMFGAHKLKPVFKCLPLRDADELAIGRRVHFWQDWIEHSEPGDEWWQPVNHSGTPSEVTAPVNLVGGWYDIFLPWMMKDYAALRNAGRIPYLMIGPWSHLSLGIFGAISRESLAWFRAHLLNDRSQLREMPVSIFVMGAGGWRDFPEFPPPGYRPQRWHLQTGGGLALDAPTASEPDRYRYDPADPTPSVGGPLLSPGSASKDNRALEARQDVLIYTSAVLDRDLEVIGSVQTELFVRSSLEHTDFFARLCDVHPSGKSFNICDGIRRLRPGRPAPGPDGILKVNIDLWPTAYQFKRGHRIRLQISSGAHPRFARNLGSGEPLATGTTLRVADQIVYHDPAHPSAIILPTLE
jgi:putative CocE/NonD family hydrolase